MLIELLVVLAIIAILAAMLLPASCAKPEAGKTEKEIFMRNRCYRKSAFQLTLPTGGP